MATSESQIPAEERDLLVESPAEENPYTWPEFDGLQDPEAQDG